MMNFALPTIGSIAAVSYAVVSSPAPSPAETAPTSTSAAPAMHDPDDHDGHATINAERRMHELIARFEAMAEEDDAVSWTDEDTNVVIDFVMELIAEELDVEPAIAFDLDLERITQAEREGVEPDGEFDESDVRRHLESMDELEGLDIEIIGDLGEIELELADIGPVMGMLLREIDEDELVNIIGTVLREFDIDVDDDEIDVDRLLELAAVGRHLGAQAMGHGRRDRDEARMRHELREERVHGDHETGDDHDDHAEVEFRERLREIQMEMLELEAHAHELERHRDHLMEEHEHRIDELHEAFEHRVEHMHEAMANLHEAGLTDQADEVEHSIEDMHRELEREIQRHHREMKRELLHAERELEAKHLEIVERREALEQEANDVRLRAQEVRERRAQHEGREGRRDARGEGRARGQGEGHGDRRGRVHEERVTSGWPSEAAALHRELLDEIRALRREVAEVREMVSTLRQDVSRQGRGDRPR